jgi:Protein of unknown function (DUF1579)
VSSPSNIASLIGRWKGTNHLWLSPSDSVNKSDTTMLVAQAAQGRFVTFQYTWAYEGAPQDGLLMVGVDPQPNAFQAIWIDSWHMQDKFMLCQGTVGDLGVISLKGYYPTPPGPDWGWQMDIVPQSGGTFHLVMHNISPEGKVQLAVEAAYSRKL